MGRVKLYSSNKDRISIHKFLREYIGIEYDIGKKLTHQKMHNIIDEANFKQRKKDITKRTYYNHPTCVNYSIIQADDIKSGRYIEVIDDKKKIIIYRNPQLFSVKNLFRELEKMDKTTLEMLRYESLLKSGRIAYDEGGYHFLEEEDYNIYGEDDEIDSALEEEENTIIIYEKKIKGSIPSKNKKFVKVRKGIRRREK